MTQPPIRSTFCVETNGDKNGKLSTRTTTVLIVYGPRRTSGNLGCCGWGSWSSWQLVRSSARASLLYLTPSYYHPLTCLINSVNPFIWCVVSLLKSKAVKVVVMTQHSTP